MESVNVVFVGHVDHGKSTTIGRLLYDGESVTDDRVEEIQKYAEELKRRFEFAYFLDALEEERKEQMTIESTRVFFKGKNRLYTIIDSPGHKEFLKNMLTGASQADAAIVIVSAQEGIEEQTRRHVFLLKLLGIEHLVVAVNKMDAVRYQKEPFERIHNAMKEFLDSLGFDLDKISFVPISAIEGENVYRRSTKMPWAKKTLIEALDAIPIKSRELDKPLRFVVQDVYEVDGEKIVVGRVESGVLRKGAKGVFEPSGRPAIVQQIRVYEGERSEAKPGECVGVISSVIPRRGEVFGLAESPPKKVTEIKGEVVLLLDRLRKNETIVVKCGTAAVPARVQNILEKIDTETGAIVEKQPSVVDINEAALMVLSLREPMVVERYPDIPELGRFVIMKNGKNIGAGVALEVSS